MKFLIFFILALSSLANAERNKSEAQLLPEYLKGIQYNGKILRHGYLLWLEKKPYTPSLDPALEKKGREVYVKNCLECHGAKGEGEGPIAKKYGVKASNIRDSKKILNTHALFIQIAEGRGDMPQWVDTLSEDEIWAVTHYLQSLK